MTQQGNHYSFLFQRYAPAPVGQKDEQHKIEPEIPETSPKPAKRPRGFAAMSPEKQRQIASQGGTAAHKKGTAHQFNTQEARLAGRKGGESVSQDREHMSEIGRKGGKKRAQRSKSSDSTAEQSFEVPEATESTDSAGWADSV